MRRLPCKSALVALALVTLAAAPAAAGELAPGEGTLWAARGGAEPVALPAATTRVEVAVTGTGAQVSVAQRFENPFPEPIEAVYVFPLPEGAAISEVRIGDARSEIRRRDEAGAVLDRARDAGLAAALLEQERDDLFTLTVASIPAGGHIDVDLSFDVPVRSSGGARELVLPATVGPRFVPGTPDGAPATGTGTAPNTDRVPDASRVTPPLRRPRSRPERSLSVRVAIDAGAPLAAVDSPSHPIAVERDASGRRALVTLADGAAVPNRDFVLRYRVAATGPAALAFAHHGARGGFVALVLEPPPAAASPAAAPFDLIVALDDSGSMTGPARHQALAAVAALLESAGAAASIQIVSLTTGARSTPAPVANGPEARRAALAFARADRGDGGSDLLAVLRRELQGAGPRVLCVVSDGLVANEREILAAVAAASEGTRVVSLGVGAAPNRYLFERMAELGRGVAAYLGPGEPPGPAAALLARGLRAPVLGELEIDWGGLEVTGVTPWPLPDLLAGQPVRILARTREREAATVTVRGRRGGEPVILRAQVDLTRGGEDAGPALARLWARERVRALALEHIATGDDALVARIAELGLRFGLVTPHTSLVVVGDESAAAGAPARVVAVPVELPAGASRAAVAADRLERDDAEIVPGSQTSTLEIMAHYGGTPRWRLALGLGLGAALGDSPELLGGAHLRLERGVLARLALGGELRALAASDGDAWAAALTASATSYHLGALHLGAGLGGALGSDGAALALSARAELDLPLPWLDLSLRADHLARRGADLSALTLGVELSF